MKTATQLTSAIENVNPTDIGRAHFILCSTGNFYKVQSSRDETVEYTVRWSKEHGFTCECESGQHGFSNCKNGVCQHVLIALACKKEERDAVAELHRLIAEQQAQKTPETVVTTVDAETLARVQVAAEAPATVSRNAKPYTPKAFSILR